MAGFPRAAMLGGEGLGTWAAADSLWTASMMSESNSYKSMLGCGGVVTALARLAVQRGVGRGQNSLFWTGAPWEKRWRPKGPRPRTRYTRAAPVMWPPSGHLPTRAGSGGSATAHRPSPTPRLPAATRRTPPTATRSFPAEPIPARPSPRAPLRYCPRIHSAWPAWHSRE